MTCPLVEAIPRTKGRLLDLPAACGLPDLGANSKASRILGEGLGRLERRRAGARLRGDRQGRADLARAGEGLGDRCGAGLGRYPGHAQRPPGHTVLPSSSSASIVPGKGPVPRRRGRPEADRPGRSPTPRWRQGGLVQARAERTLSGWRLELFFPGESLNGFDPETSRRLGFYYPGDRPRPGRPVPFGVGREFPIGEDPEPLGDAPAGRVIGRPPGPRLERPSFHLNPG